MKRIAKKYTILIFSAMGLILPYTVFAQETADSPAEVSTADKMPETVETQAPVVAEETPAPPPVSEAAAATVIIEETTATHAENPVPVVESPPPAIEETPTVAEVESAPAIEEAPPEIEVVTPAVEEAPPVVASAPEAIVEEQPAEQAAPVQPPSAALITDTILKDIKTFVLRDIVILSIQNQNQKYETIEQSNIDALDKQWREETKKSDQPLISATLSNPLSSYLTRMQAQSLGLYTEIFVMDDKGLNVGQSNISSDYWQGDEDKFKKTYPVGINAVFIDEPELKEGIDAWVVQVNMTIADSKTNKAIGAATIEVNLTELERRTPLNN